MRLQAVDAGIRTDSVLSMRVALNFSKYTTPALRAQFLADLGDRLKALPGVRSAGGAGTFPLNDGGGFLAGVRVEGQPEVEAARLPRAEVQSASPGLLSDRRDSASARPAPRRARYRRARDRGSHQRLDGAAVLSQRRCRRRTDLDRQRAQLAADRRRRRRRPEHAGGAAVADVLSPARTGAAPDGHVPGADVRRSGGARAADARGRARNRPAAAGRSVPDARRGPLGVALGAAADGHAHRRLRRHRAADYGRWPRGRHRVLGQPAIAGVRRPHGARRVARVGAAARPRPGAAPRAARPRAGRRRRHRCSRTPSARCCSTHSPPISRLSLVSP